MTPPLPKVPKLEPRFRSFLAELDRAEGCVAGHSVTVCKTALSLARSLGVAQVELPSVALGALMHDIGKVFVAGGVLSKAQPLGDAELHMIRLHPLLGEALLEPNLSDAMVLGIIRWHHERWDGTGYPDGLSGAQIPLGARIVGAADAFTAMRESRAYRRALSLEEAVDELRALTHQQFDDDCVEALVGTLEQSELELRVA